MPPHDPQVQDAANHAVKSLQQRSNSLFPYELQEIVHAKAEVSALHLCVDFNSIYILVQVLEVGTSNSMNLFSIHQVL